VGPLVTDEIDPWTGIGVETRVNGAGGVAAGGIPAISSSRSMSSSVTIRASDDSIPGDLIATGTPGELGQSGREMWWK